MIIPFWDVLENFVPHDHGGSGVFWLDEPRNRIHYSSRSVGAMPDYRDCFALFLEIRCWSLAGTGVYVIGIQGIGL